MKNSVDRNTTKNGKYIIKIGFRSTDCQDTSLTGKIATYFTSNGTRVTYQHVELMFSDQHVTSITKVPGTIHYDLQKLMSNKQYSRFYELHVTWDEEQRMQNYAENAFKEKIPFNKCGMYWNFIPYCFTVNRQEKAFFCSEYIVKLLQEIGRVPNLISYKTSPNELFVALENDEEFMVSMNTKFINFCDNLTTLPKITNTTVAVTNKKHGLKTV